MARTNLRRGFVIQAGISAPGARRKGLAVLLRPARSLPPYSPSPLARPDAEAGYAHHHGRAGIASGISAGVPKILLIELEFHAFAELRRGQGGGAAEEELVPAPPNRALF
jgi:hypothetical protein